MSSRVDEAVKSLRPRGGADRIHSMLEQLDLCKKPLSQYTTKLCCLTIKRGSFIVFSGFPDSTFPICTNWHASDDSTDFSILSSMSSRKFKWRESESGKAAALSKSKLFQFNMDERVFGVIMEIAE